MTTRLAARFLVPALVLLTCAGAHGSDRARVATPLRVPLAPTVAAQKLELVQQRVKKLAAAGRRAVAVFDIDDTLIHNGPFVPKDEIGKAEPGAVAYVRSLATAGATVVYLTGRHASEEQKTIAALKKVGLPLGQSDRLLLNPDRKVASVDWKRSATPQIRKLGTPVALFDNEFENVRMFRLEYPRSAVFRLNTSSNKPDPGGKGTIFVISDFATK